MTVAVTVALREKLEQEKAEQEGAAAKKSRYEVADGIRQECAPLFKDGRSGNDLINDFYDDVTGLPK